MDFRATDFENVVSQSLPAGRLLLCVSGGADSMALLHACVRKGLDVVTVHCDFHLRGAESERDRRFVSYVCRRLGVRCEQVHFDVMTYMRTHGVSMEMACRELRYAEFRKLRTSLGCTRIVTAHNRDDNDETMLLNLFRGTGVAGLCGMESDSGEIARPLLEFSRKHIEEYLSVIKCRYIIDSSNLSVDYRRNFIRHELMPLIASRWPGIRKSLWRTRRNMNETRRLCDTVMSGHKAESEDFLSAQTYTNAPSRSLLLMEWLKDKGASPAQIDEMSEGLMSGRQWILKDRRVVTDKQGLHLLPLCDETAAVIYEQTVIPMSEDLMQEIRTQHGEKVLYHNGSDTLSQRTVHEGDRIYPYGMKGSKLVSDLLREAGIPLPRRKNIILFTDSSNRIIWIPGVRRSRFMCVNPSKDTHVYILRQKK